MSDTLLSALIGGVALIVATLLTVYGTKIVRGVRRIRDQVENDHDTNMREEGDARHQENTRRLDRVEGSLDRIDGTLGRIADVILRQSEDIEELQRTAGKKEP